MKIAPNNYTKTIGFRGCNIKADTNTNGMKNEIDTWDKQMFGLSCCLTVFSGIDYIKNGFKQANTIGKIRNVAEGTGMALGLALMLMPLWKF